MRLKALIEAALFVSEKPLTIESLQQLLAHQQPQEPIQEPIQEQALLLSKAEIRVIVNDLIADYQQRGIELVKVASGYRFQAKAQFSQALTVIFQEKAPKYSRAFLETLALIAYKQPITRAEIEAIRGVSVSSHIMKTLVEHHWIKNLGQKEVPGRPSLYGTTKVFLDHFSLSSLAELPVLTKLDEKQLS
ncbi:MAG: SMC-Scp complex subunit ScpB [Gammaproteobacteria bacterium]|nr:MAG: SMC-Scp complex subunit ScpB [Gammaproteobacteria bacterium]